MKKIILSLFTVIATLQGIAQQSNFDTKYLKEDNVYHFDDLIKLNRTNIFTTYKNEFGLTEFDEMRAERTIVEGEKTFTKYLQYHKGYLVENYMMNANGQNGIILTANGMLAKGLNVDISTTIKEGDALSFALNRIGATLYPWQDDVRENNIREETENPLYTSLPKGKLLIVAKAGNETKYALAWKFNIESLVPHEIHNIYIDAKDGSLIYDLNQENEYSHNISGTGWTWYNGQFSNLGTGHCNTCTKFRLNSNNNVETYEQSSGNTYPDNNNNWVENSYYGFDNRKTAHSAHWSIEKAKEYYLNKFGRWGSDYNGKIVWVWIKASDLLNSGVDDQDRDRIRLREDFSNIAEPSANNAGIGYSVASLDVLAHEYTHNMIRRSSGLVNYGESGALNEGFADIFGILTEKYITGNYNWSIGENIGLVRKLDNPNLDYYMGGTNFNIYQSNPSPAKWGENMGVWWKNSIYHFPQTPMPATASDETISKNSGVLRHWFYLLANGGTYNGVTVQGIGIDKAEKIAYNTFNWYVWSTAFYIDCANGSVQATKDLYGFCSPEHKAVVKAWRAVTGNYPLLNCLPFQIDGQAVVKTSTLSLARPSTYTIRFDETIRDINADNIIWAVPNGWNVQINGSKLDLLSTTNTASQILKATYRDANGNEFTNSITVHFTDENVIGDNILPSFKIDQNEDAKNIKEDVLIYPNPANNNISILLPFTKENPNYIISDINGRVLLNGNIYQQFANVNVSSLSNGIYILQIKSETINKVQKIIVQK